MKNRNRDEGRIMRAYRLDAEVVQMLEDGAVASGMSLTELLEH
jgi:hypothetical protein